MLSEPGKQPDRRVGERVRERLRLLGLQEVVGVHVFVVPGAVGERGLLLRGQAVELSWLTTGQRDDLRHVRAHDGRAGLAAELDRDLAAPVVADSAEPLVAEAEH
jgi:hypothetical protein